MSAIALTPAVGATVSISATDTTGRIAIGQGRYNSLLVSNVGDDLVYINWGDNSIEATTADIPIPRNASIVFSVPSITYVAAICDTTESTIVKFTPAEGL